MTQPPQDGYGSPRYRGQRPPPPPVPRQPPPPQIQPRQPPPQPPTSGFGYWDSSSEEPPRPPLTPPPAERPSWQSPPPRPPYGYEDLYEDEPPDGPGAYGYAPVPAGPQQVARSKTKLMVLLVGTIVGMLLAAGGVYYMVEGEGGGETGASAQENDPPGGGSAGERPEGGTSGDAEGKDFAGKWRSRAGAALTIGAEARSGDSAGKQAVSYNRPGRLTTCPGVGEVRKSGAAFRLALRCANGKAKSELAGDAVRSRGKLTVEWEGGTRDAFTRQDGQAER